MPKAKDISNQRFGKLIAIKKTKTEKGFTIWLCECDCGNFKEVRLNSLSCGLTTSCGCKKSTDLTGEKFGRLVVLGRSNNRDKEKQHGTYYWVCKCDCGETTESTTSQLTGKKKISCGCSHFDYEDIKGKVFGYWTALDHIENGHGKWLCICMCGNEKEVDISSLKSGHSLSCGCYKTKCTIERNEIDLIGRKFGRLTVLEESHYEDNKRFWKCLCECGNNQIVPTGNLTSGNTVSCGCFRSDYLKSRTKEQCYNWQGGLTKFNDHLRQLIKDWKFESLNKYDFKCIISGNKNDLEIHHLEPFHKIVKQVINDLNLEYKDSIGEYSIEQQNKIESYFLSLHNSQDYGVPLTNELHNEFHSKYGNKDFTPENFQEFFQLKTGMKFNLSEVKF